MKRLIDYGRYLPFFILIFLLVACGAEDQQGGEGSDPDTPGETATVAGPVPTLTPLLPAVTPPAAAGDGTMGRVFIDELRVSVLESFPVQVQATVGGNLSDGCTSIASTSVERNNSDFEIQIETTRDPDLICTQALVPFEETIALDVRGLAAGSYSVTAGDLSESFTLDVDNELPPATPDLGDASLTVSSNSAMPGETVELTGEGYPPGVTVEIGIGPPASEYEIIGETEAGADGRFTTQIEVPAYVEPGDSWVFVADVDNAKVTADPIMITAAAMPTPTAESGGDEPGDDQFTSTNIFLIAIDDQGRSGEMIGCNDSVVPVEIEIEPTNAPLTAALNLMLDLEEEFYGQSGLYNVFNQSDLTVEGIDIEDGVATVQLEGTLSLGGVCDNPRVMAQLEQTMLQYSTVDSAHILLNGEPIESLLSGQ